MRLVRRSAPGVRKDGGGGPERVSTARARDGWGRAPAVLGCTLCLALATGCTDLSEGGAADAANGDEAAGDLLILAYDRSPSVPDHQLEHAGELTAQRLRHLDHGDRIVALEVLERSLEEPPDRWSDRVPERTVAHREVARDSVSRGRFVRDVRQYLSRFTDPEEREELAGTDILATLHLVEEELEGFAHDRALLVLFSDMLHAGSDLNMEGRGEAPSDDWVERRAAQGRLPDLEGLCVVVAGARDDTPAARRVRDFWMEYFEAVGARLGPQSYDFRPVRLPEDPCRGT